jgi:hypothetical protein
LNTTFKPVGLGLRSVDLFSMSDFHYDNHIRRPNRINEVVYRLSISVKFRFKIWLLTERSSKVISKLILITIVV